MGEMENFMRGLAAGALISVVTGAVLVWTTGRAAARAYNKAAGTTVRGLEGLIDRTMPALQQAVLEHQRIERMKLEEARLAREQSEEAPADTNVHGR